MSCNHTPRPPCPHKTPRHWVFVDTFPLTPSGKVQKFILREQFSSGLMARSE
jgi:acyl-coenzyme A synthetase/AMP-(fatty) acid ligase